MLTSNDYKELAARCAELASESSQPTVAEALRALASDYLARAAKMHFVFLEQGTRKAGALSALTNQSGRSADTFFADPRTEEAPRFMRGELLPTPR